MASRQAISAGASALSFASSMNVAVAGPSRVTLCGCGSSIAPEGPDCADPRHHRGAAGGPAVAGWRLLEQDRILESQQVQERVERAADLAVAALERPRKRVAYLPAVPMLRAAPDAVFTRGEDLEFRAQDHAAAVKGVPGDGTIDGPGDSGGRPAALGAESSEGREDPASARNRRPDVSRSKEFRPAFSNSIRGYG